MHYTTQFLTLPGKKAGSITVHPIVELIVCTGGQSGAVIQVIPRALIVELEQEVLTYVLKEIKITDRHSVG